MSRTEYSLPREFISPATLTGEAESSPVLVAFSGGSDSTALLHMCAANAKACGGKVYAAHINHMIRGEEADRDEQFCLEFAKKLNVEIFVCRKDVPKYAKEHSLSIETAARLVRYEFFDSIMKEHGIRLLATAHNANDNLETQIFNLARGCGIEGMCGIPVSRSCRYGTVVRPILRMSKDLILEYCSSNDLCFVTDSTNTDTEYTRNMIRAEIIPALKRINSGVVENSARLSCSLKQDALCLDSMAEWFLDEMNDDASFECEKLLSSPPSIANRAIMALYKHVSEGGTLEHIHISSIRELCRSCVAHSSIDLPLDVKAKIESGRLYLEKGVEKATPPDEFCVKLGEGVNDASAINAQIIIGNSQNTINIYKKSTLLYLDFDKISGDLYARNRLAGDKIRIRGINKSVKKLLCDMKIPLDMRYRLPMICDDKGIVAIPFVATRDGAGLKANEHEKTAVCIKFGLL
ncbi:MAG: tRNA lysidine(34) synthetase TilS [Clostridia bacterium]|nr:tRNA lysidine(34) synthetase TilS [Clostridia bacterium]